MAERLLAAIGSPTRVPTKIAARHPQRFPIAWLVAAAAVMALLTTNLYWLTRVNNAEQPTTEATEYSGTQGSPALVLNTTDGLRWVHLPASAQDTKASAVLMWNAQSEIGLVYATGFPQLVDGTTYQLWLTNGPDRVSAGTFTVDQNGKGAMLFHITQPIDQYTWARITTEPLTGSPEPTGAVVVIGQLTT
jgi:anti-sigma-K factor RskA